MASINYPGNTRSSGVQDGSEVI